ncbi:wall-associated receptor kinase 5-like [Papaver somniferum]|uniref:wall-associated receptor kinase 5-like n=1 Tax=Papaver somniferum TaxID=3469 RepID=UPI000E701AF1|nr:wall-associated receptor kinase 5-like [Papaver somniferum]
MYFASGEIPMNGSEVISKHGCQNQCGNVRIPYPFGIGPGCFLDKTFEIICQSFLDSTKPVHLPNYNISDISILDGQMTTEIYIASDCPGREIPAYYMTGGFKKFTFSDTKNKFIGMGCNTWAYQKSDDNVSISTGCLSVCDKIEDSTDGSCNGVGCCQASVPAGLHLLNFSVGSMYNAGRSLSFNPCSYAFIIEGKSFNFSLSYFKDFLNNGSGSVPVVVDWTVGFETCDVAKRNLTSYACGPNTDCIVPAGNKLQGYRCNCRWGYTGNPYLHSSTFGGCRDVDECKEICKGPGGKCENTEGSYKCVCNNGYSHEVRDNITYCIPENHGSLPGSTQNNNPNKIVVGACLGLFLLLLSLVTGFWIYWGYRKRKHMEVKEEFFKKNGGLILNRLLDEREEDVEASRNGRVEKKHRSVATIYTEKELSKATNNYHESQILGRGGFGTVYKGTLSNGEVVAIKKTKIVDMNQNEQFINEIAVLSQINHKNVVQLLGCCLESEVPLLVYEYIANGTLHQHLHEHRENQTGSATLSWEHRLRIASEVAGSLAYLHAEASIPIIHRDVKSSNVLLDDDYKAKVSDFGGSRLNPTDQAQLSTVVQGTFGYLDPEYMQSNQLTDKSDVYSFGVLLVELLTGKAVFSPHRLEEDRNLASYFLSSMKTNRLFVILDDSLVRNDNERVSSVRGHQQIQEMAELAQKCLRVKGEKRPSMKEVAVVLHGLMRMSSSNPWVLDDDEDINDTTSKEERMLLLESAELLSYPDSITTIGDSSKGISALQTEGR